MSQAATSAMPAAPAAGEGAPLVDVTDANDAMGFDAAVLGQGLAPDIEALIEQAGLVRSQRELAEPLLLKARALAPTHPATLIALYRFHFYGHRLREAREVSIEALAGLAAWGSKAARATASASMDTSRASRRRCP